MPTEAWTSTREKDQALWRQWKRTHAPQDLQALLTQMQGVIQKEVNRWQGALARDILELEAARLAKDAFETYDPKAAGLSTHLTTTLQKLSRIVYTHQNAARMPEYQTLKLNTYRRAQNELENSLGRPPTLHETADHLAWSQAAVIRMRDSIHRETMESANTSLPVAGRSSADVLVDMVYHDLSPTHKLIFEHTTGYAGAPVLSGAELMKKLKLSQGQLSYEKRKLISTVKGYMDEHGE